MSVALRLVSQGRLSLDDTIGELLPGVLPNANRVTLAQALGHTGSFSKLIRSVQELAVCRALGR